VKTALKRDTTKKPKMSVFKPLALVIVTWLAAGSTAFAEVHLTIRNGQVSLVAKDATVRQILTEWARVGQTKIVNVERIPGGPITLELKDLPEQEALDVLLRSVSGYMAAPRATGVANASAFDRIIVMPTSVAPRAPAGAAPPPVFPQPGMPGPFGQPRQVEDDQGEDERPVPSVLPPNHQSAAAGCAGRSAVPARRRAGRRSSARDESARRATIRTVWRGCRAWHDRAAATCSGAAGHARAAATLER
jgi:hypothetical protein